MLSAEALKPQVLCAVPRAPGQPWLGAAVCCDLDCSPDKLLHTAVPAVSVLAGDLASLLFVT